jgi:hypothetical protein
VRYIGREASGHLHNLGFCDLGREARGSSKFRVCEVHTEGDQGFITSLGIVRYVGREAMGHLHKLGFWEVHREGGQGVISQDFVRYISRIRREVRKSSQDRFCEVSREGVLTS